MKVCKKCEAEKPLECFYRVRTTGQIMSYCKPCHNRLCVERRQKDPVKAAKRLKEWKQRQGGAYTEKQNFYHRQWRSKNADRIRKQRADYRKTKEGREAERRKGREKVKRLAGKYVKRLMGLSGLFGPEVDMLVECKREQIKLNRKIREYEQNK